MQKGEINGFQNEIEFVKYLNNRLVKDCHPLFDDLLFRLYGRLYAKAKIICWKNVIPQKTDIFIKINGIVKRISLKMGMKNSVHVEGITEFIHFLITCGIPRKIVIEYLEYQYADGTTNGSGTKRLSVLEYKKDHQDSIDSINYYFNQEKMIIKAINRFVLQGRNDNHEIDALVFGTINDFLFIDKQEIKNILLDTTISSTGVHVSHLSVQPLDRCLNENQKFEKKRFCVQIKWFSLFDDIIKYKNDQVAIR